MQSAFRSTSRSLSNQVVNNTKHAGFIKKVISDPGNIPIIAANLAACGLLTTFGLRKLLFHPDITLGADNRFSPEVQNETGSRLDQALVFREQTRFFARMLYEPTMAILKLSTGTPATEKFHLNFLKDTTIPLPLEATDVFDDDLYRGNKVDAFAANISNDTQFIGSIKDQHKV